MVHICPSTKVDTIPSVALIVVGCNFLSSQACMDQTNHLHLRFYLRSCTLCNSVSKPIPGDTCLGYLMIMVMSEVCGQ